MLSIGRMCVLMIATNTIDAQESKAKHHHPTG